MTPARVGKINQVIITEWVLKVTSKLTVRVNIQNNIHHAA